MMIRRRWYPRGAAVSFALIATVATACSSSSGAEGRGGGSATSNPETSSAAAGDSSSAATGAPIDVGLVCDCSGPIGPQPPVTEKVVEAWARSVNDSGGLNGHPINLIEKDDTADPAKSLTIVQGFIAQKVDVIFDVTVVDEAWQNLPGPAGIPVLGAQFNTVPYVTNPDFFPAGQTNDSINYSVAATAKAAGAKTLGQLYCAESPQCQEGVQIIKRNADKVGVHETYEVSISATSPNYTAQCLAAKQAGAQALVVLDSAAPLLRVGSDCTNQNYHPIYVTEGAGFSPNLITAPGYTDNTWTEYATLPSWAAVPVAKAMRATVQKYYPGLQNDKANWTEFTAQGWSAAVLLEHAVKASGLTPAEDPSAATILKGLNSITNDNLDGWSPPLTFRAGKPHPVHCWFTGRIRNGVVSLANNGKYTCGGS